MQMLRVRREAKWILSVILIPVNRPDRAFLFVYVSALQMLLGLGF